MQDKMVKFPEHKKIIFPASPKFYRGSCARCTHCEKKWPNHKLFTKESICCGAAITILGEAPDVTWETAKKFYLHYSFDKYYDKYIKGLNEEEQLWLSTPLEVKEEEVKEGIIQIEKDIDETLKSEDSHPQN